MTRPEWRAVGSLSLIYLLRMLGLFMILPVFSVNAQGYTAATPLLIGLAVGIYGLTQAMLQIPFGALSDRLGRKPVIAAGLLIFVLGSLLAAFSSHIGWVIAGRALQGAGAIAAVVTALLSDLTSERSRTPAMAVLGITIGFSFLIALIIGPVLVAQAGLSGVFVAAAVFGLMALAVLMVLVPSGPRPTPPATPVRLLDGLTQRSMQPLYGGIFLLHCVMTAAFVAVPVLLRDQFALAADSQWKLFAPVMLLSILPLPLAIALGERRGHQAAVFAISVVVCAAGLALCGLTGSIWIAAAALAIFFGGFNVLEASLPSLASKAALPELRGAALGAYSSAQFIGAFCGGVIGGALLGQAGAGAVLVFCAVLLLFWLAFLHRTPFTVAAAQVAG